MNSIIVYSFERGLYPVYISVDATTASNTVSHMYVVESSYMSNYKNLSTPRTTFLSFDINAYNLIFIHIKNNISKNMKFANTLWV